MVGKRIAKSKVEEVRQAEGGALQGLPSLLSPEQWGAIEKYLATQRYLSEEVLAVGKQIFDAVMREEGLGAGDEDTGAVSGAYAGTVITHEALVGLILYASGHQTAVVARARQQGSADKRSSRAVSERDRVFAWCAANPLTAWRSLHYAKAKAMEATNIRKITAVRDHIRDWRKENPKK